MKKKKYHIVGTVPKSNRKILERGKIDMPKAQMHDYALSLLHTCTLINSGVAEMIRKVIFFK